MKQPKKPTRAQKELIRAAKLNEKNWMIADEDNISFCIIHKTSGKKKVLFK